MNEKVSINFIMNITNDEKSMKYNLVKMVKVL